MINLPKSVEQMATIQNTVKTNWKSSGLEEKMHFTNEINLHFRLQPAYMHSTAHYERVVIRLSRLLLFWQLTTKYDG